MISVETREKMSIAQKNIWARPGHREHMSEIHKNPSAETRLKMSESHRKKVPLGEIKALYAQGISPERIGKQYSCSAVAVCHALKWAGVTLRNQSEGMRASYKAGYFNRNRPKGNNASGWKGGIIKTAEGYVFIYSPEHSGGRNSPYVRRSHLVWEQVHNKPLPKGWIVHHLNGIKDDDRPENLVGMPSKKHSLVLQARAERIRKLEIEVSLLREALAKGQVMFDFGDN